MSNDVNTLILKKISKAYYGFESILTAIYLAKHKKEVKKSFVEINNFLKSVGLDKYIKIDYVAENNIFIYTVKYKNNIDPDLVLGYITLNGVLDDF